MGVSWERGGPDPGKTLQIRCRRRAEGDKRAESGKQAGTEENVYYMTRHLLAGGSDLLEGDCFSISPRQSSNTLAVQWGGVIKICWVVAAGGRGLTRTDIYIILRASLDPGSVILSRETLTFVGRDLSKIPIRTQVGTSKAAAGWGWCLPLGEVVLGTNDDARY